MSKIPYPGGKGRGGERWEVGRDGETIYGTSVDLYRG